MSLLLNSSGPCTSNRTVAFTDARPTAARRVPAARRSPQNVTCSAEKQDGQVRDNVVAVQQGVEFLQDKTYCGNFPASRIARMEQACDSMQSVNSFAVVSHFAVF